MDKVEKYRKLVRGMLTDIADRFRRNSNWKIIEAFDEKHGQYLLFTDGWEGEHRDYGCFVHLKVKEYGSCVHIRNCLYFIPIAPTTISSPKPIFRAQSPPSV